MVGRPGLLWLARLMERVPWRALRDTALFVGGIVIAYHEVFQSDLERPSQLILAAAMMGLPFALRGNNGKG